MSAIRINKEDILYLVQAAMSREMGCNYQQDFFYFHNQSMRLRTPEDCKRLSILLDKENAKSICNRYYEKESNLSEYTNLHEFSYYDFDSEHWSVFDPVQVLKSIQYYIYQSCEHPEFKSSEAYSFLETLKDISISLISDNERFVWGTPERSVK